MSREHAEGKILVVDDAAEIRCALTEYLEGQGYTVTAVADGEHALQRVHRDRPDLILLDILLPGMSGLQVLRRVRHHDSTIGIIVMTGLEDEGLAGSTIQLGAIRYLRKPFGLERLDRAVLSSMGLRRTVRGRDRTGIGVSQTDGITVVAPEGDLDRATADHVTRTLTGLVQSGSPRLVVDLSAVSSVDSSGLGALVAAMKRARAAGGDLKLCAVQDYVLEVLEMTGLVHRIVIRSNRQDAVTSFAPSDR